MTENPMEREKAPGLLRRLRSRVSTPMPEDLTPREVNKRVFNIFLPAGMEMLLSTLANMVDMMMVGQLGAWAVAAVGLTTQPKFVVQAAFLALNSGATALVARFRGQEDQESANTAMRQAILITTVLSVLLAIAGYFLSGWMVSFMGAQSDTIGPATDYLRIQMIGFPFMARTMVVTATMRGVGNTRVSLIYNMIANAVNVVLNYLLIYGHFGLPRLEVAGASLATIIGQAVACFIAYGVLLRGKHYLKLRKGDSFRPNFGMIKRISKVGVPALFEQVAMRTGMLLFVRTVSQLGTVAYATHNIVMNILSLSFTNGQAFGVAAVALVGRSLGARRPDHAKIFASYARRMGMLVSVALAAVFVFFGRQIVGLYITLGDPDAQQILRAGAQLMLIVAAIQPLQSSQLILAGALRGAGDTRSTAIIIFFGVTVVRPIAGYIGVNVLGWGLLGAWAALVLDQSVRSVLSFLRFHTGKWMHLRI